MDIMPTATESGRRRCLNYKYNPLGAAECQIGSRFSATRHMVGEAPFACLSFTNRRICSLAASWAPPWRSLKLKLDFRTRWQSSRSHGDLWWILSLTRKTRIIRFFFWIYIADEMRQSREKGNIFRWTYRSQLIGPSKKQLTPYEYVQRVSCDRMIQDNERLYKYIQKLAGQYNLVLRKPFIYKI